MDLKQVVTATDTEQPLAQFLPRTIDKKSGNAFDLTAFIFFGHVTPPLPDSPVRYGIFFVE